MWSAARWYLRLSWWRPEPLAAQTRLNARPESDAGLEHVWFLLESEVEEGLDVEWSDDLNGKKGTPLPGDESVGVMALPHTHACVAVVHACA